MTGKLSELGRAALAAAQLGYCVFPVRPKGKKPLNRHGFKEATRDPDTITAWWTKWPSANIGAVPGKSGLIVIDVDGAKGRETAGRLGLLAEPTHTSISGRADGGEHRWYVHPGGKIGNTKQLGEGTDVRADGGYVVLPPSVHPSGRVYHWADTTAPAMLPPSVAEMLRKLKRAPRAKVAATTRPTEVRAIGEGDRHTTLASEAGLLRRAGADAATIGTALVVRNSKFNPPQSEGEVLALASSIAQYPVGVLPTDLANSELFLEQHTSTLRFCAPWNAWLVWDGRRWARDERNAVCEMAKDTARSLILQAAESSDPDAIRSTLRAAYYAQQSRSMTAMVRLASSAPALSVVPQELDADPWLLNVRNGTINLKTGVLQSHAQADLITRMADVDFDPQARSTIWEDLLAHALPDEAERAFFQRAVGYSLTGDTSEEKLFMVVGPSATSKSTVLNAVRGILSDYAAVADFETFLQRQVTGGAREDLARLDGQRMVVSIEVESGARLASGLVKMLTGGDKISARRLYEGTFEFLPQFKLWLCANDPPRVRDDDTAIWRRVIRIPFEHVVPEADRDPGLKGLLANDQGVRSAILRWAVDGSVSWLHKRLAPPVTVLNATEAYRQANDPLNDWINDALIADQDGTASIKATRESYDDFCRQNGVRQRDIIGLRKFNERLVARGWAQARSAQERHWVGFRLATDPG